MADYREKYVIVLGAEQVSLLEPEGAILMVTGLWFTAAEYDAYDDGAAWPKEAQIGLKMDQNENIEVVSAPVAPAGVGYRILD